MAPLTAASSQKLRVLFVDDEADREVPLRDVEEADRRVGARAHIAIESTTSPTTRPRSSPALPTTTSSSNGSATLLWSTHTVGTWYSGSALVAPSEGPSGSDDLAMLVSGGDWYDPPYPFFVVGGDAMTGAASFNATSVWPGSVWPTGGLGALSPGAPHPRRPGGAETDKRKTR